MYTTELALLLLCQEFEATPNVTSATLHTYSRLSTGMPWPVSPGAALLATRWIPAGPHVFIRLQGLLLKGQQKVEHSLQSL